MDKIKRAEMQNTQSNEGYAVIVHRGGGIYRVENGMCRTAAVGYAARPAISSEREGIAAAHEPASSGDRAGSFSLPDGRLALILSDGMGSGIRAAAYSKLAVSKLKHELKCGTSPAVAIKSANRSMCACLTHDFSCRATASELSDAFATLDLVIFDANKNCLSFYKQGAAPSYILREGKFKVLRHSALPVGVLPRLATPNSHVTLRLGDVLIMMSDGISDVYEYDFFETVPRNLSVDIPAVRLHKLADNLTAGIKSGRLRGPGQIAKAVIDFTVSLFPQASDDMTVIAFVIA